jgi:hypothetical protein
MTGWRRDMAVAFAAAYTASALTVWALERLNLIRL